MKHSQAIDKLAKLLGYMLGRQPDEFGLLPDADGYVPVRELIKAVGEEPGGGHVRLNHIREVIHGTRPPGFEMEGNRIRALDRSHLIRPMIPDGFPKLLYHPVRRRAQAVVMEEGLYPTHTAGRIVLADDMVLAQRLGRRIDPHPVILTVNSDLARKNGAILWRFGRCLFLSDRLPLGSFSAPPLPHMRPMPKRTAPAQRPLEPKAPGSYTMDPTTDTAASHRLDHRSHKRKNEWKRDRKQMNRSRGS